MIEVLKSDELPTPKFRYSPMLKAGSHYQMAGMIALDKDTGLLESGGIYQETKKILSNLVMSLPDFGLELKDMINARIFTTDFSEFAEINKAWEEVFSENMPLPTRTALGVSALPLNAGVEIEFYFYRGNQI
jgi:2-iminobutanoate/2-iminopropanoate deaminase